MTKEKTKKTKQVPKNQKKIAIQQQKMSVKQKKPFKCDYCGTGFGKKSRLIPHFNTKHFFTSKKPHYQCPKCSKLFLYKSNLTVHFKKQHSKKKAVLKNLRENPIIVYIENGKKNV